MDQPLSASMALDYCSHCGVKALGWSLHDRSAPLWFSADSQNGSTMLTAVWDGGKVSFTLPFVDDSSIENGCHCFAALLALEVGPLKVIGRFGRLESLSMRLELKKGIHGCTLLNDFYNSDINSLEIALSVLNRQAEKNHLEKVVILSDIRQSGLPPAQLYRQVNNMLKASGVERLIGIGSAIRAAGDSFSMQKQFFNTTGEFLGQIRQVKLDHALLLIKGARDFRFEDISEALQEKAHQTILEINLNALVGNLNIFKGRLLPGTKIMVMVKAFSYGSGDVEIAKLLQYNRVDYLAVAVTDEGKELRKGGITLPIIVMNPEQHSFQQMIDLRLEPNLFSVELAGQFARVAALNAVRDFPVHLKIDTGMNRLGLKSADEIVAAVDFCRSQSVLRVQSLFSHLAASDDPAMDGFTLGQISRFMELGDMAAGILEYPVMRHILNSAGIERFAEYQFDMVRLGIGLYGVSSTGLPLKAISRLKSTLSQIKDAMPGETVGYNRSGVVDRPSRIAIIPVGYADGLDRRLGNGNGMVCINETMAPLIGNICMDMCMADVTDISCKPGDEAEFFGERISIREVAERAGTIPYEILTGISQRVKRIYVQE